MNTIANVDSDLGNSILKALLNSGWTIAEQYPKNAFDKGIDYDFYTLKNDRNTLFFEWDNWSEWLIKGEEKLLTMLRDQYGLKNA